MTEQHLQLKPATDEEIKELAKRIVRREVFITNSREGLDCAFGLLLSAFADVPEEEMAQVGAMWEEISKAGPRSINGYPFFMSAHYVLTADVPKIHAEVKRMEAAIDG